MKLGTDANGILGNGLSILLSHSSEHFKMLSGIYPVKLSDHRSGKVVKVSPETVINSFTSAYELLCGQGHERPDLEDFLSIAKGSKEKKLFEDRKKVSEGFLFRIMGRPLDLEMFKTVGRGVGTS